MFLYAINVESCIHVENYRIFLYEPVARRQLELFDAVWTLPSLIHAFQEVAGHINRRGFEGSDYQVVVCVRRRESERWKETTMYARALVCQALEQSGTIPVITSAYTRKVTVLFQVEQPYYGTVPKTAVWEEEMAGLNCFLNILGLGESDGPAAKREAGAGEAYGVNQWEGALTQALEQEASGRLDPVTKYLKERLCRGLEEDHAAAERAKESSPEEELPESPEIAWEEETEKESFEYISHRLRSLLEGSGFNRCTDVIYWPVPRESSRANRVSMLCLVDLLRFGEEVTRERVQDCFVEIHPDFEETILERYRKALAGYREQLLRKKERILQEIGEKEEETEFVEPLSLSLPELSFSLAEKLETARQQIVTCALSLQKSKRKEVRERVEDISQTLAAAIDGLENELVSYEREVAACMYREIEGHPHAGFARRISGEKSPLPQFGTQKRPAGRDEQAGKAMIRQWKQDMETLTECAELTRPSTTFLYLAGAMIFAVLPYVLLQGLPQLLVAFGVFGLCLLFLLIKRRMMPGFFIRSISQSYRGLGEKLTGVLEEYEERAVEFRGCVEQWLIEEKRLQRKRESEEAEKKRARFSQRRAWHLANIQKTIDRLETFQTMETLWMSGEEEPEALKRILQPMDYEKSEMENEIYWPVIEKPGKEGTDDE